MKSELVARVREIERVTPRAYRIQLHLGGRALSFSAGQAASVGLLTQVTRKPYAIASAPAEVQSTGCIDLVIGTDAHGRLGLHLDPLVPGSLVGVAGPMGSFALPARVGGRNLLFLAGGTGVVPLRSMLRTAIDRVTPATVDMVYSVRTPADFIFDAELRRLHRAGRIRYVRTVTRLAGESWAERCGRIDAALLQRVRRPHAVCLLCGPQTFVEDVSAMLRSIGARPSHILRDEH
jgi:NAD(P)H-flavin reductase